MENQVSTILLKKFAIGAKIQTTSASGSTEQKISPMISHRAYYYFLSMLDTFPPKYPAKTAFISIPVESVIAFITLSTD